jgi:type III secretory pathway component EscU
MLLSIALMYLMLIIWSILIIPFVIIGLMDIWFDYRRNMPAVGG